MLDAMLIYIENGIVIENKDLVVTDEVLARLCEFLDLNKFYSSQDIKAVLTEVYLEFGITKKAAATHIKKYFTVQQTELLKDGSRTRGYMIYEPINEL